MRPEQHINTIFPGGKTCNGFSIVKLNQFNSQRSLACICYLLSTTKMPSNSQQSLKKPIHKENKRFLVDGVCSPTKKCGT